MGFLSFLKEHSRAHKNQPRAGQRQGKLFCHLVATVATNPCQIFGQPVRLISKKAGRKKASTPIPRCTRYSNDCWHFSPLFLESACRSVSLRYSADPEKRYSVEFTVVFCYFETS